ncbi:class I SAM-dependent methyltransferase [Anaerocolumna sp. AGMB13025]|uniref:class I SAM-dependent methyltransferase n=1 Tax=Anaerocolumna sp. AGMB13025 TaxID=3039116 RepID=UPI00241F6DA1|nr:class I SAM-dependent methyltransferase [Anaerocolumna sp. AGMB13025]WFR55757.1 class I SAM-dependent methyltransferase [Anaerocolumna sp. AGMB13025]
MSNMNPHTHSHTFTGDQNFMNKINFLDSVMRKKMLPPEELLKLLPIQEGSNILDAGAGSGYLTIPAAKCTTGTVYALDMDVRMLEVITIKANADNITNIDLLQGNINNIPISDNSVDFAIASLILHEVGPLSPVLAELFRVLKDGGSVLCLEYEKEESSIQGPPMHIRISSVSLEQELIAAGFSIEQKFIPGESLYIITAKKQEF